MHIICNTLKIKILFINIIIINTVYKEYLSLYEYADHDKQIINTNNRDQYNRVYTNIHLCTIIF